MSVVKGRRPQPRAAATDRHVFQFFKGGEGFHNGSEVQLSTAVHEYLAVLLQPPSLKSTRLTPYHHLDMPRQLEGSEGSTSKPARPRRREPYGTTKREPGKADENSLSRGATKADGGRFPGTNKTRRSAFRVSLKQLNAVTGKCFTNLISFLYEDASSRHY